MTHWQFSTEQMTVYAAAENGIIVRAAPIIRKFVGQPFSNLYSWLRRQPGFCLYRLKV